MSTQTGITTRFLEALRYLIVNKVVKNQAEFCRDMDYLPQTLSNMTTGTTDVSQKLLENAVTKYNLSPAFLLKGEGPILEETSQEEVRESLLDDRKILAMINKLEEKISWMDKINEKIAENKKEIDKLKAAGSRKSA